MPSQMRQPESTDRPGQMASVYPWRARVVALALGAIGAALFINSMYLRRQAGEEVALGRATTIYEASVDGTQIASARVEDFGKVYDPSSVAAEDLLWLGNSQLHAINQIQPEDHTAPFYATTRLDRTTWALSLPNASLQEHLAIAAWAIQRRPPDWLIVGLVFDDLREHGMRRGLERLEEPAMLTVLAGSEVGERIVDQLSEEPSESTSPNAPVADASLQSRAEAALEEVLSDNWSAWRQRNQMVTALQVRLYRLRNWVFGIQASSKRRVLPVRRMRNMAALEVMLELANQADAKTLLYVVPLRWDVEPPYVLSDYEKWKVEVRDLAARFGAHVADLDRIVPDDLWGSTAGEIDFMHFQGPGHEILGEKIAELIASIASSASQQ